MATMLPTAATPVQRVLQTFNRAQLAGFIEVAIGLLDLADGDPEAEPATWTERDRERDSTPTIDARTDDHEANGDEEDAAFTEWLSRGRHKLYAGEYETLPAHHHSADPHEDAEDDDVREDDDADEDGDPVEDDDASEPLTWPERDRQPDNMGEGLGGWNAAYDGHEPKHQPVTLNRDMANDL